MSYCIREGKDTVIVVTEEDHYKGVAEPAVQQLIDRFLADDAEEEEEEKGPLNEDGSINWSCPCMASLVSGPCGYEYRQSFSCYHESQADPKGSDCLEKMSAFADCLKTAYGYGDAADGGPKAAPDLDMEEDVEEYHKSGAGHERPVDAAAKEKSNM